MRLLFAAIVCLFPALAMAQPGGGVPTGAVSNSTVTATGSTAPRTLADWTGDVVNVKGSGSGATGNTRVVSDAAITSGQNILTSATAAFTPSDVGKTVALAGAGSGLLLQSAVWSAPGGSVANPYAPGDTVTLTAGTGTSPVITVATTQLSVAAVNAGGTGYPISSTFDVYVTGSGTCSIPMVVNVTTNGSGVVTTYNGVTNPGQCSVNPTLTGAATTAYLSTTTGSGLTLNLGTGVNTVTVSTAASQTALPANPVSQASSSGSGTGATFTAFYSANLLATTISGYTNATTVTLTANASLTTSAQWMAFGADDSAAFQAAETTVCAKGNGVDGGGGKVMIPTGIYIVNNVNVTCPTTWEGLGAQANGEANGLTWAMGGSFIVHTSTTNPSFNIVNNGTTSLPSGSRFTHLGLFEVHPADYAGWAPIPYPYFISAVGTEQENITLDDLMAAPVYQLFVYNNGGKFKINQVHGEIFGTGFNVSNIGDVSRIDDVHFWPFWETTSNIVLWSINNADAWVSDSEGYLFDKFFEIGMRSGMHFKGSSHSNQEIHCGVCAFDQTTHGLWFDNLQHTITLQFGSLYMWNASESAVAGTANVFVNNPSHSVGVYVTFDYLESHYGQPIRIEDGSTNVQMHILSGYFTNNNGANNNTPAIFVANQNSSINSGAKNLVEIASTITLQPANVTNVFNLNTNAQVGGVQFRDIQTFNTSGTWSAPPFCTVSCTTQLRLIASGPGGGQGAQETIGTVGSGGASGGAGACIDVTVPTSALTSTVSVTVSGTGGAGGSTSVSGPGQAGSAGSNTTFGSYYTAYTGGAGAGGQTAASSGGGAAGGIGVTGFAGSGSSAGSADTSNGSQAGGAGGSGAPSSFGAQNVSGSGSSTTTGSNGPAAPCVGGSGSGGTLLVGSATNGGRGGAVAGLALATPGNSASSGTAGSGANAAGNGALFPSSTGAAGGGANTGGTGGTGGGAAPGAYGCAGAGGGAGTVAGGLGGAGCGGYLVAVTTGG